MEKVNDGVGGRRKRETGRENGVGRERRAKSKKKGERKSMTTPETYSEF